MAPAEDNAREVPSGVLEPQDSPEPAPEQTELERKLDAILGHLDLSDERATAGEAESEPDPTPDPTENVDETIAGTVEDVLSSLEDPVADVPAQTQAAAPPPDPAKLPEPKQPGTSLTGTRSTTAEALDTLLQEIKQEPAEPPVRERAPEPPGRPKPPRPAPPEPAPAPAPATVSFRGITLTHVVVVLNSLILLVLVIGQFHFFRYASVVTGDVKNTANRIMGAASETLDRIDEKLTQPPRPDVPRNRLLYSEALTAADQAFDKGDFVAAANLLKRLLEAFPDFDRNDHALFRLGECYTRQERPRWNDAVAQYLAILRQFPSSHYVAPAHLRAAHCYGQLGSYRAARKVLLELLAEEDLFSRDTAPSFSEARYRLGQYYALDASLEKGKTGSRLPEEAN
jgi:tetratricopeptide (TPR) repeat protein